MVAIYLIYLALHQRQVNLESCNMHALILFVLLSELSKDASVRGVK